MVSVLFIFDMLKVTTTITKTFPSGTTSTWKFGVLPNGWFAAKCLENGKKRYFKTQQQMDNCVRSFMHRYGYTKPSMVLVKQLALAV